MCYRQFTYVNYNPKGSCKYGSQVGVILKRLYLGIVDVRDEDGRIIETRVATRWTDYFWKKDECGVTHAKRVKQEFWVIKQSTMYLLHLHFIGVT